jgi:RNA polymerase sigma factor (TIGR02999 family)
LYDELRKLAAARMARQQGPQTLQATALVHEAWLRLGGDEQPEWTDRTHLFAAVAEAMRHILVDRARRRQRIRHGGGLNRVDMDAWNWERLDVTKAAEHDEVLLAMHDALERLAMGDKQTAKLVKLHFFAGLTVDEAAENVKLPKRTAERRLAYARAWLGREIRRGLAA